MDEANLLKRFRNAKRRCLYWSGIPTFSSRCAKATMSGKMAEKYELYMCDQQNLADRLRDFGVVVSVKDYKSEFQQRWSKMIRTT